MIQKPGEIDKLRIPVLSVSQRRQLDALAMQSSTSFDNIYMERAGQALFDLVCGLVPESESGCILIFAGKGNNGGDALVLARLLFEINFSYRLICYAEPEFYKGDAKKALDAYLGEGGRLEVYSDSLDLKKIKPSLIVDGLLGSGAKGPLSEKCRDMVQFMNANPASVVSVDCPTGFHLLPDESSTVRADYTLVMGYPSLESYFFPAAGFFGKILVADLKYPPSLITALEPVVYTADADFFKEILPKRKIWGSKKDHGLCLIVAGSRSMTGAARLSAEACMRSGAGMTWLVTAAEIINPLASQLPEVIYCGMSAGVSGSLGPEALEKINTLSLQMNALCIGPGLSINESTQTLVHSLIETVKKPTVLDADGLNAFKGCVFKLKDLKMPLIITPHQGEWERLFGPLEKDPSGRTEQIMRVAQEYRMVIVLKGKPSLIAGPDGEVFLLNGGSSGMATAGSGDVLSGIICALTAQGCTPFNAALLGVWLHQKAGEIAAEHSGEYSMIASDMISHLYLAFKALDEHQI